MFLKRVFIFNLLLGFSTLLSLNSFSQENQFKRICISYNLDDISGEDNSRCLEGTYITPEKFQINQIVINGHLTQYNILDSESLVKMQNLLIKKIGPGGLIAEYNEEKEFSLSRKENFEDYYFSLYTNTFNYKVDIDVITPVYSFYFQHINQ